MISAEIAGQLTAALGSEVVRVTKLGGGCVAEVLDVVLADGLRCVAKIAKDSGAAIEAKMLEYLRTHTNLPVPAVLWSSENLIVLEHVRNDDGPIDAGAEHHAADLLADLHGIGRQGPGFEYDTLIGGLVQPNAPTAGWLEFFRDRRLAHMGRRALDAGGIAAPTYARIERLRGRLGEWIPDRVEVGLLHGDVWGGNVLVHTGRVAAFVDPAIYYGDPEVELAFVTLFGTFGRPFFDRYAGHRKIESGFFEVRRDLYNLYPLLVHAALFGGSYAASIDRTLRRLVG